MPILLLTPEERKILLELARRAVAVAAEGGTLPALGPGTPGLSRKCGVFVTLKHHHRLRGCIGLMESSLPLAESVVRMAAAAAVEDPRFPPVASAEVAELQLEISVLSPLKSAASAEEIVLGQDGVMVQQGAHSGVFLPQVATETGWDKERFLSELCAGKAGLPPDAWKDPRTQLYTFTVEILAE